MPAPVVLVVEDEPLLRMAALAMMEDAGFAVIAARNSDAATAALDACPDIDVVFTDVDLGVGQDGIWLAAKIRSQRPEVGIIVTSGHRHVTPALLPEGTVFFEKPYLEDRIVAEVRRMTV